jgi:hypothetical protein
MGTLCSVALTCANRKNFEGYKQAIEELYQMIHTIEQESGFEQNHNEGQGTTTTSLAPEGEQAAASASATDPAPKGTGAAKRPRK